MTDDQLDALARELPSARLDPRRIEAVRTSLLAAVGDVMPLPASVVRPRALVAAAIPIAVAAAAALWLLAGRDRAEHSRSNATIAPTAGAELAQLSAPPDEIVYLHSGGLTADVSPQGDQRFRVITTGGVIEAQAARFVVAIDRHQITSVEVIRGSVAIRPWSGVAVELDEGERWSTSVAAEAAKTIEPPAVVPPPSDAVVPPPSVPTRGANRNSHPRRTAAVPGSIIESVPVTGSAPVPGAGAVPIPVTGSGSGSATIPIPVPVAAPGEAEFRAGWDALRHGDSAAAATSFASSRRIAGRGAIAEDASFWEGVALARAGRSAEAITALRRFVSQHGTSARAGEASARLGWLLLDAAELDAAERALEAAASDRVPAVRRSARAGLDKIAKLRAR